MNFSHKLFKIGPEFFPTISILLHPKSIAHVRVGINMASHGES